MRKFIFVIFVSLLFMTMEAPFTEASSDRLSGSNRYITAVEISKNGWSKADTVVLAVGNNFPDALAGGPLAYKLNAPILLSKKDQLGTETRAEVSRLGAKKAIILGSSGVLSSKVEKELRDMGLTIERIGGSDRYETAALIAKKLGSSDTAIVAYGRNFPDALAVAPYAARNGIPILLSRTDDIPNSTKDLLKDKKRTYVVGGTSILSNDILKQMPNSKRISGASRFDTANAIIREFQMDANNAYVATGMNFADALTGSVLAAKKNGAILLVRPSNLPDAIKELLNNKKFTEITALGGTNSVSDGVLKQVKELVKNETVETALTINLNQEYTGVFGDRFTSKYYKFNIEKPGNVDLGIKNLSGASWDISIIDRSGKSYIDFTSNNDSYATGYTSAPIGLSAGEYFIKITTNYDGVNKPFAFKAKFTESDYYEQEDNNTAIKATNIKFDKQYTGSLQARSDLDYYKIDVKENGNATFKMKQIPGSYWDLTVLDEAGNSYLSYSTDSSQSATGWKTSEVGLPPGSYYISIKTSSFSSSLIPYYLEVAFEKSNYYEKEFNSTINTANDIKVNQSYQGNIQHSKDEDFYKFTLPKAGNINIKASQKTDVSINYTLYNNEGEIIESISTDESPVADTETNIPVGLEAGEYYLKVRNYSFEENLPYEFKIGFDESAFYERELNNSALTATQMVLNETYYGTIQDHSIDHDYFKFTLESDSSIQLSINNKYDMTWRYDIYDNSGENVATIYSDDDQFAPERTIKTIDLTKGEYFIRVYNWRYTINHTYDFKISN